ncbi:MAG TPA: SulP family inorganic anion transporter [Cyclobacteriaceae bacterium]|nr:SulP family inorganic anion transporter [Cyclobacteriaceae bacterium]
MRSKKIPNDGLAGLKQNWSADMLSGFLVFLLALPLSLGIARASEFPPAMGVLAAMIGGLFVSFFAGSRLTIKGPTAGLITVCSGAVLSFGGGEQGWHLTCGVIVVTGVIQIAFGFLKLGSLGDFFPLSAVHGLLAAIGIIIIGKEVPILLGVSSLAKGLSPIELYLHFPQFIANANPRIALIGVMSLIIIFGFPYLGRLFNKVAAPLFVLVIMIPLGIYLDIKNTVAGSLVSIGDFWSNVGFNASFANIDTLVFWKYVVTFLFVNSLESLLAVKAIDTLDPWKRKSDYNKDLSGLGVGNAISGLLGGLPMISEVVRSGANVNFGARTTWANFFHGLFLFLAMLLLIPAIEMIPNAALAAMLIYAGYRLASPRSFTNTYKIGPEQLVIFLITIIATVAEGLLVGILAGIVVKTIFHLLNGVKIGNLFKADFEMIGNANEYTMVVSGAAIFSNYLGFKKAWDVVPVGLTFIIDFSCATLVDHSFMEQLHYFMEDYVSHGGRIIVDGLQDLHRFSGHPFAARKSIKGIRT